MIIDADLSVKGQVIDRSDDAIKSKPEDNNLRNLLKRNGNIHVKFAEFSELISFNSDESTDLIRDISRERIKTKTRCDEDHTDAEGDLSVKGYQKSSKEHSLNSIQSVINEIFKDRDFKNSLGFKSNPYRAFIKYWNNESKSNLEIINMIRDQENQWSLKDNQSIAAFKEMLNDRHLGDDLDPSEIASPSQSKLILELVSNDFEEDLGKAHSTFEKVTKRIVSILELQNRILINKKFKKSQLLLLHRLFPNGKEFRLSLDESIRINSVNQNELIEQLINKEHEFGVAKHKQAENFRHLSHNVIILDEIKKDPSLNKIVAHINLSDDLIRSFKSYLRGFKILTSNKEFQEAIINNK